MGKQKTIHSVFKRKVDEETHNESQDIKRQKATTSEPPRQEHPILNDDEIVEVILEDASYDSDYTREDVRKDVLGIIANKVRKHIRDEVGDSYFCVMVDVLRDESKKEHMAIFLRFVDAEGMIRERFLDLVHVRDTLPETLKTSLWGQLLRYQFNVRKIRGQSYNGASNMRDKWNELQALVLNDCPSAYYVHSFAHRLPPALVCASREVLPVHQFFKNLVSTINVVCASSKKHDDLQKAKVDEIKKLLELGETKSREGIDQVGTLKRADDTRWGSYFISVCSFLRMFDVTRVVIQRIVEDLLHTTYSERGDADAAYAHFYSFEFVFILHLIKEVLGRTETLSHSIQNNSQYILNVMELVSSTKVILNNFKNNGWDTLLTRVTFFCDMHQIEMPDMSAPFIYTHYQPRKKHLHVTNEHYYRVDLFTSILDKLLHELNSIFNDQVIKLLSLSSSLVEKDINVDQICHLVREYYPEDFTVEERSQLRDQLETFNVEKTMNFKLSGESTISDLCKHLVETQERETYYLVDRVIRLILTLPISTATTEREISSRKVIKKRLRNKMSDEYIANSLVIKIEREISEKFNSKSIIDEFKDLHSSEEL